MFPINDHLSIPESEFTWSYARSGGPGGQNVNKVASKALLRWSLAINESIPEAVKARLRAANPSRMTTEGDFLIVSQESRDQEQNRELCLEKLVALVRRAVAVPKARKKTKPTKASQRRRVEGKRHAAERKGNRDSNWSD
jgi:ribosome-associated protein